MDNSFNDTMLWALVNIAGLKASSLNEVAAFVADTSEPLVFTNISNERYVLKADEESYVLEFPAFDYSGDPDVAKSFNSYMSHFYPCECVV